MTRGLGLGRTLALAAACTSVALLQPRPAAGARPERYDAPVRAPTISGVAAQLGVRVHIVGEDAFAVGTSFTGSLQEPAKLASFGIAGFHTGARVTAIRMGPDKVLVDADEDEPAALRKTARLVIDAGGALVAPGKA
jgi:hypothetical protein